MSKDSQRQTILQATLREVPFDGWTDAAYAHALKRAGIERGEADLLLPAGIRDVIELFGAMADAAMAKAIAAEPGFRHFKIREKIAFAVRARLEALTPHREAMRRMMYWYALPTHVPLGLRRLYKTVDLMWRAAGDTATDFNFYTRRALLAGVLKTTILFWLDDETPGCRASWEFLDRRIGEVLKIGKTISLMKEWRPADIVDMLRTRMRRA
jgi:ubiquinone biosynthesis protein COQ9